MLLKRLLCSREAVFSRFPPSHISGRDVTLEVKMARYVSDEMLVVLQLMAA